MGPRPERPHFVNSYSLQVSGYGDRHRVPGGLTGLAQVHGLRGDTSIVERARFDNFYIEHWSPWQDTKILLRTGAAVVRDALNDLRTAAVRSPRSGAPDTTESSTPGLTAAPAASATVAGAAHRQLHGGPDPSPAPSPAPPTSEPRAQEHTVAIEERQRPRPAPSRLSRVVTTGDRHVLIAANLLLLVLAGAGHPGLALSIAVVVPVALAVVHRPQRGVLLLVALVPFDGLRTLVPHPAVLDGWKEALVVGTLGATFVAPLSARALRRRRPPAWFTALVGLFAVAMVSAIVIGGTAAIYGLKIMFFYLLLAAAIWRCPLDAAERDRLVTILFVTGVCAPPTG